MSPALMSAEQQNVSLTEKASLNKVTTQHSLSTSASSESIPSVKRSDSITKAWGESKTAYAWQQAVYSDRAKSNCMGQLFKFQLELFKSIEGTAQIDVGCGTGDNLAALAGPHRECIGVDILPSMLELAKETNPILADPKNRVTLIEGDATELGKLVEGYNLGEKPVVAMLMNTFGILPEFVRVPVLREMWNLIGNKGQLVVGCWNKAELLTGFNSFYSTNPDLCGNVVLEDLNLEKGTLGPTDTGYTSQWWDEDTLRKVLLDAAPFDVNIRFEFYGVGIFAIGEKA